MNLGAKLSLLEIKNLNRHFYDKKSKILNHVLKGISFTISEGEKVGIVGESGCGKTTLAKTILNLHDKHTEDTGSIMFRGNDIHNLASKAFRPLRSELQIMYQDPFTSLNQKMSVEGILIEALKQKYAGKRKKELLPKVRNLMQTYRIQVQNINKRPSKLSGGECRRVGIARVMALEPSFLIADEPVASLDASIKDQIMQLLVSKVNTLLTISHDMRIIQKYVDKIVVLYAGMIVEISERIVNAVPNEQQFKFYHPYSKSLLESVAYFNSKSKRVDIPVHKLNGENGMSSGSKSKGCPFIAHCPKVVEYSSDLQDICRRTQPTLKNHENGFNATACHYV